jgi:hypothetical protein
MRISLLLKREPFGKILEQTLSAFLEKSLGFPSHVTWHEDLFPPTYSAGGQIWLCNAYLNAIFIPEVKKEALLPIIQEFSRSTKVWRRPLQKLYVKIALKPTLSRFLATHWLEITPPLNNPENILILGGNHHIRFHDYGANKATVIAKAGSATELMQKELKIRTANPYLPCPPILEKGEDGTWYSEPLVEGTPLNRLSDKTKAAEAVRRLKPSLFQLYRTTVRRIPLNDYVEDLVKEVEQRVHQYPCPGHDVINTALDNAKAIKTYLESRPNRLNEPVAVVQTHGDFQPANILVDKDDVWLIDWEYTAPRQAAYDLLVLALGSRFAGLSGRIPAILANSSREEDDLFKDCPFVKWDDHERKKIMIALFLLEELTLRLRQDANPLFKKPSPGFDDFLSEMRLSFALLKAKQEAAL